MRNSILASIPKDLGKVIRYDHQHTMTVSQDETCEVCGQKFTEGVVIQGETDSFGFEPVVMCLQCHTKTEEEEKVYKDALDVDDRAPTAGNIFLVSECKNHDDGTCWTMTFISFRRATAYYRRIERMAEPKGGLYPAKGIREIPEEEGKVILANERKRAMEEYEASWQDEEVYTYYD